jgi:putative aminopeptidase FrvX
MKNLPEIDLEFLLEFLVGLLNTPSPTGYTDEAIEYTENILAQYLEINVSRTRKGALVATIPGIKDDTPCGLTAHIDTLGAMVKEIKSNGRLKLTKIGGFPWNTVEGEGCTIITNNKKTVRGSILLSQASVHVYGSKLSENKRDDDNMEIRLDERTNSEEETRNLGIEVGDYISFDPRVEVRNGFIRSRHLDDKACVACVITAVKALNEAGLKPKQKTTILISNFEEVGHGASTGFPDEMVELVAVDMAAVGEGQSSDEFNTTICVKDSGGPYHHGLSQKLRKIADEHGIPYKVDIYPYYGSDGEAFWRAGGNVAVALIGPGVDASHNYERTHTDALHATTRWLLAYLLT